MNPLLQATALTKRHRHTVALDDLYLTIPSGRMVALVGPNGSGKSTLMQLAVGLQRPTEGSLTVLDTTPSGDNGQWLARLGYVDQRHPLMDRYTVADMLRFGASTNPRWNQEIAAGYLAANAIATSAKVGSLSGGHRAQVSMALALGKEPEAFFLDEPAAALDPVGRETLLQTLADAQADRGVSVLLSTHAMSDVVSLCDYVIVLTNGRVALEGDIDTIVASHYRLSSATAPDESVNVLWGRSAQRGGTYIVRGSRRNDLGDVTELSIAEIIVAYLRHDITGENQ